MVSFGVPPPSVEDPFIHKSISRHVPWGFASGNTSKEGEPLVYTSLVIKLSSMRDEEREGGRKGWREGWREREREKPPLP